MHNSTAKIQIAIDLIKNGELVAFPTETVYGIGANALNSIACAKIYQVKGRPSNNPLIVHVASIEDARSIGVFNTDAELIAKHLWPGPITLVLPLRKNNGLSNIVTAGLDTVAIRIPSSEVALNLIKGSGCFIAAPSANPSGYVSATTALHVSEHFDNIFVLHNEEPDAVGLESTILDLSTDRPTILRYGFITPEALSTILNKEVKYSIDNKIKAPGMISKHYAPRASVRLEAETLGIGEYGIGFGSIDFGEGAVNLSRSGDLVSAARVLYSILREADILDVKKIAVAPIPNIGIGLAINDRLKRASMK